VEAHAGECRGATNLKLEYQGRMFHGFLFSDGTRKITDIGVHRKCINIWDCQKKERKKKKENFLCM